MFICDSLYCPYCEVLYLNRRDSKLEVYASKFHWNTAGEQGGAIYLRSTAEVLLHGVRMHHPFAHSSCILRMAEPLHVAHQTRVPCSFACATEFVQWQRDCGRRDL